MSWPSTASRTKLPTAKWRSVGSHGPWKAKRRAMVPDACGFYPCRDDHRFRRPLGFVVGVRRIQPVERAPEVLADQGRAAHVIPVHGPRAQYQHLARMTDGPHHAGSPVEDRLHRLEGALPGEPGVRRGGADDRMREFPVWDRELANVTLDELDPGFLADPWTRGEGTLQGHDLRPQPWPPVACPDWPRPGRRSARSRRTRSRR